MLHLMNTLMMPSADFAYVPQQISARRAKTVFLKYRDDYKSYIGYPNACKVASELFDTQIELSRDLTEVKLGDIMLCMKLRYRVNPEEKGSRVHGGHLKDYDFFICQIVDKMSVSI